MIRKYTTLTFCYLAIVCAAGAQELGVELDGGLQGMHYTLQNGKTKLLPGVSLGLNYVFPLYQNIGLLTGVNMGVYRTQAKLQGPLAFAYPRVDDAGAAFLYNVRFNGYEETQRTLAVTIPVLLHYHTNGELQWWIDGGGKLFLPANTNIRVSAQQMTTSGYYPNDDLVISDLPKHGFGTVKDWKSNASAQLKPGAALSGGTGVSFGISSGVRLYSGIYVDYGLTALKSSRDSMPMVSYSATGIGNVEANGVLRTPGAGQPKLLSYGIQFRLTWGARPGKHPLFAKKKPAASPVIVAPAGTPISDGELITIQRPIVFGIVGETDIPGTQTPLLDDVIIIMRQHPDLRISIVGYTCDGVQQTEDSKLGETRAKSVARYLERRGIDRRRMDLSYQKESDPSKTYDPAANYRNRRVLISPE